MDPANEFTRSVKEPPLHVNMCTQTFSSGAHTHLAWFTTTIVVNCKAGHRAAERTPCLFLSETPSSTKQTHKTWKPTTPTNTTHTTLLSASTGVASPPLNKRSKPHVLRSYRTDQKTPCRSRGSISQMPLRFWSDAYKTRAVWYERTERLSRIFSNVRVAIESSNHTEWLPATYMPPGHVYNYNYMFQHHHIMALWSITTSKSVWRIQTSRSSLSDDIVEPFH